MCRLLRLLHLCKLRVCLALWSRAGVHEPCSFSFDAGETTRVDSRVGILLGMVAAMLNAVGLHTQKLAHDRLPTEDESYSSAYLRLPLWWIGLLLILVAELCGSLAFGFAPAAIVSSLGSLVIVFTTILAVMDRGERLSCGTVLGIVIIVVGTWVLALSTPSDTRMLSSTDLWTMYKTVSFGAYVGGASLLLVAAYCSVCLPELLRVALGAALVSSFTVLSVQGIVFLGKDAMADCRACRCRSTLASPLLWILVWIVVLTAIVSGVYLEQYGLQAFRETQWIPMHFVCCVFAFTIASALTHRDLDELSLDQSVGVVSGMGLVLLGVLLTSRDPARSTLASEP